MYVTHGEFKDVFAEVKSIEELPNNEIKVNLSWWNWGQMGIPYSMNFQTHNVCTKELWRKFKVINGSPYEWIERSLDPRKDC